MIDTADLAILETYADAMDPVERELLAEVRRLHDEAEDVAVLEEKVLGLEDELKDLKSQLEEARAEAREEVKDLERLLSEETRDLEAAKHARDVAERALLELKAAIAGVLS